MLRAPLFAAFLLLAWRGTLCAAPPPPELQTWSSLSGQTIVATIVGVQQNMVSLQNTNGVVLRIRIGDLTPPGQAAIAAWVEREKRGPAYQTEGVVSNKIPVFTEGPGAKYYAVYTHPNFIARITADAQVRITLMDGTNAIGKPLVMRALHYYVPWRERTRAIVKFDACPPPTLTPKEVTFTGQMTDGVTFSWSYAFVDNTVQGWGWIRDPTGIEHPTRYQLRVYVPESYAFENSVPLEERRRLLAPFSLRVDPPKGKTVIYPFWQGQETLIGSGEKVYVDGPVYGARRLAVTASNFKEGRLIPLIYRGKAPYEGFTVALLKNEIDKRSDRFRLIVTID